MMSIFLVLFNICLHTDLLLNGDPYFNGSKLLLLHGTHCKIAWFGSVWVGQNSSVSRDF